MAPMTVTSSDGVDVAVHDLGGRGPTLLVSHATGFHARCYEPLAAALSGKMHAFGLDYRGHGLTPTPRDWVVDWEGYADDAVAAAQTLAPTGGLIGFGHSMGGACLLMAAHRFASLFRMLVIYEPIVFPFVEDPSTPSTPPTESPLAAGARRRRADFDSVERAIANYASKPPMMNFHPDALRAYVEHGFEPTVGHAITLRCRPEHEAMTFETGARHRTWEILDQITTPVVVVTGRTDPLSPAAIAEPIARALPNAEYIELAHLDHFGPMTHPAEIASVIVRSARV